VIPTRGKRARQRKKERLDRQSSYRTRLFVFERSGFVRLSSRGRLINGDDDSSINVLCNVVKTACFSWESQVDCQRVFPGTANDIFLKSCSGKPVRNSVEQPPFVAIATVALDCGSCVIPVVADI